MIKTIVKNTENNLIPIQEAKMNIYGQHKRYKLWYMIIRDRDSDLYFTLPLWNTTPVDKVQLVCFLDNGWTERELFEAFDLYKPDTFTELCTFMKKQILQND